MKMPPTDVVLVTGYLGAGKSTLLNQLLQLPEIVRQQPALIINEFGQEGVDGRLFDDVGCPMFEINRGSLFCICTKTDLLEALSEIARLQPGIVLIEATGVAETRDIESLLDQPKLDGLFRVRANVCVVDALNFTKVAPFLKAARNQVATADGIVINKVDLAAEQALTPLGHLLTEMNPRAKQVHATCGNVAFSFFENLSHQRTRESLAIAQPEAVYSASFRCTQSVDRARFEEAIEQLGDRLLRLKGHVLFGDQSQPQFVETVCGALTVKPAVTDTQTTAFTAIAFGLPDGQLQRTFGMLVEG